MSPRRRHVGRVKVAFETIEAIAAEEIASCALAAAFETEWRLTRHSALYRCRDGRFTLCLVWHGAKGQTMTTMRDLELVAQ